MNFLINTFLRWEFNAQTCRNWITFPFKRSDVQLQVNPSLFLCSYKACISIYFVSRRWSNIKLWSDFQKNCFFRWHCAFSWWGGHRNPMKILIVLLLSTLKLLQKSDRSTEKGFTFPNPVENPSAFPVTIGITVLLMSSITLLSFWTHTIHGTWLQQLLCHSITVLIDTLCPISTPNQPFTNLEQTHIRCSLHCEGWTVKGRECASALHSLNKITYQTDEWTKQLL